MPRNATAFQSGAADGSRTHLCSLGSCRSTDELQPHLSCYYTRPLHILQPPNLLRHERLFADIDSTIEAKGDHHEKTRRAGSRPVSATVTDFIANSFFVVLSDGGAPCDADGGFYFEIKVY